MALRRSGVLKGVEFPCGPVARIAATKIDCAAHGTCSFDTLVRILLLEDLPGACSRAFLTRFQSKDSPFVGRDTPLGTLPLPEIVYWANLFDKFNHTAPDVHQATQSARERLRQLEAALDHEAVEDHTGGSNSLLASGEREFTCPVHSRFRAVALELEPPWLQAMEAASLPIQGDLTTRLPCRLGQQWCTCSGAAISRSILDWEASPAASQQCVLLTSIHSHYALLREAFNMVDQDRSGGISAAEVSQLLATLGKDPGPAKGKEILEAGDANHDGMIDFVEFVAWEARLPGAVSHQLKEFKELFAMFDEDQGTPCVMS